MHARCHGRCLERTRSRWLTLMIQTKRLQYAACELPRNRLAHSHAKCAMHRACICRPIRVGDAPRLSDACALYLPLTHPPLSRARFLARSLSRALALPIARALRDRRTFWKRFCPRKPSRTRKGATKKSQRVGHCCARERISIVQYNSDRTDWAPSNTRLALFWNTTISPLFVPHHV